jgi:hypothetical protein
MKICTKVARHLLPSALMLALAMPVAAQESAAVAGSAEVPSQYVSPEAQAVLDRMAAYLRGLQAFSITTDSTRDEIVALGYKLQGNEHSTLVVQRPGKLRADISGDRRNRTIVYDGSTLLLHSPDDQAYVRTKAPGTLGELVPALLAMGADMPLIDVLYLGTQGTLTEGVRGGILVGQSQIEGRTCDHLAFRQASIDWQLWVEQGARALPCKILITTRYEVGDPQYQAVLHWDLKPKIDSSTFAFTAPAGTIEIPLARNNAAGNTAP